MAKVKPIRDAAEMARPKSKKPSKKVTIDLDAWEAVDLARGFMHLTFQAALSQLAREGANRVIEAGMKERQDRAAQEDQAKDS